MPSPLTLRTEPKPRETVFSFVSRLAAVNGVSLHNFLNDFGIPKRGFFALQRDVVDTIAQLADLNSGQIENLVSWTGLPQEGVRMAYRGEEIVSRAIRNPEVRGCPDCLRQDAYGASDPSAAMAMRGHWLLRHSLVCVLHGKLLVPLWSVRRPGDRDDTQARLSEIGATIKEGTVVAPVVVPSAFDMWLDKRLVAMTDASWLGRHPLHVAATMCELVGHLIVQDSGTVVRKQTALELHRAYAMGFDCMIKGQQALEELFDRKLADRVPTDGPAKVFHPLYRQLGKTLSYDPGFDHFRDLLRERVLAIWPIGSGETILGVQLQKRRLHSITSLSQETGTDPGTLRRLLTVKSIVAPGDDRPNAQITFPTLTYDRLAPEISDFVFSADVRDAMGATEKQFDGLVAEGLIAPRISEADLRRVWLVADGLAILEKLQRPARPIALDAAGWMHIQEAAWQHRAPLSDIFTAVAEGRVQAGKVPGIDGYGGIYLRSDEISALFRKPQHIGFAPSTFGVSVGVKTGGAIQSLIDQGYMTVTDITDARTGVVHQRVLDVDAESFHAQFLTWRTAAAETDISSRKLKNIFRVQRVNPFETPNGPIAGVFDKKDVLAAIRAACMSED